MFTGGQFPFHVEEKEKVSPNVLMTFELTFSAYRKGSMPTELTLLLFDGFFDAGQEFFAMQTASDDLSVTVN